MSVTKIGNAEGELISRVDVDSKILTPTPSQCSCVDCDSMRCFSKRNKAVRDRSQCAICKDLRTCSAILCKDSQGNRAELESATKKIIKEVVTRETIESLKRVTETMYEYGNNESFRTLTEGQSKLSNKEVILTPTKSQISYNEESSKKSIIADSQNSDEKECCKQNLTSPSEIKKSKERSEHSPTSQSQISNNRECCRQRLIAQVPSSDVGQPLKDDMAATKLSAQVMNVPYEDLNESVLSSHEPTEQNLLTKLNIFRRIKEIYEACSCKVCECISSKPRFTRCAPDVQHGFCKCKPCDCQDCVMSRKKIEQKVKPHSGCPCIRCDRKDCQGITKKARKTNLCDCNPTDTVLYPEKVSKNCTCEPCQCINCSLLNTRTPKTVKLGEVNAIIQRETCNCSPCECIECKQIYSRTNPTIMCTTSTEMAKHRNYCRCDNCRIERCQLGEIETCKCERHNKTMRKTFENDSNDYDIRTVIVENNGPFYNNHKQRSFDKDNTVALIASVKNNYSSNSRTKGICECIECECIVCNSRNESLRSDREHLRPKIMSLHNTFKLPTPIMNSCKCTPCECEICSKKGKRVEDLESQNHCRCDVCDCLNCDHFSSDTSPFTISAFTPFSMNKRQPAKPIRSMDKNKNCDCNHCDCKDCKKLFSCSSSVKFYTSKKRLEEKTSRRARKVMLVTPSTSESRFKSTEKYMTTESKHSTERVFQQNLSTCHAISYNNHVPMLHNMSSTNKDQVCQLYQNGKEYSVISDNDDDSEMFLYNPVPENAIYKSIDETPILNYSCDFPEVTCNNHNILNHIQDEQIERNFNIVHNPPDKITSNDSEDSFPVFWACRNDTLYPRRFSRTTSKLKENLSDRFDKTKYADFKNNEKSIEEEQMMQNDKSKRGDAFTEYLKQSYYSGNYNYSSDHEYRDLRQGSLKYTDFFSNSNINSGNSINPISVCPSEVNVDYERATRILSDAKAFSSKLIKMLDSFETANRQFESASQKFMALHESLLDINESELNKYHSTNLGKVAKPILDDIFEMITEVRHKNGQYADESVKNENEAEKEYEQSTTKPPEINDNLKHTEGLIIPINSVTSDPKYISKTIVKTGDIRQQNAVNTMPVNDSDIQQEPNTMQGMQPLEITMNKPVKIMSNTRYPQLQVSDSYIFDSSQALFNTEPTKEMVNKNVTDIKQKHRLAPVMTKLDSVFGNTPTVDIVNDDAVSYDTEKTLRHEAKQRYNEPLKIFKKNLYIDTCSVDKTTVFESSRLELDIKEAVEAISLQTANNENFTKVIPRSNEALANLQHEVNKLLNMPLLQTSQQCKHRTDPGVRYPKSKLDLELKRMSSASSQTCNQMITRADKEVYFNIDAEELKTSSDQLKANIVSLRRVSDHTVLVKWNVPKRIKDVQGYELLVDGRAVQQILSPARRMAVLTCLPPAERVLLTVRTLAARCGHAPTASVVYRPRK